MNVKKLGVTRPSKEEKYQQKSDLKKIYLEAKLLCAKYSKEITEDNASNDAQERLSIQKDIMKEIILKLEELKRK
jgi:hypothetical protein